MAADLRAQSEREKAAKVPAIMDVNARAVDEALRASGCRTIIHGHTHRPGHHTVRGESGAMQRWVLPDWRPAGGYLLVTCTTRHLREWPA